MFSAGNSKLQTLLDISEPSNPDCYVGHWGFMEGDIMNPFHISTYDGGCRGLYGGGSGNATKIQLSETYTFNGMTASVG